MIKTTFVLIFFSDKSPPKYPMLSPTNAGSGVFNDSSAAPSDVDALNNMLKSNALLNPALLSINPSLYAVQLAQLQAAQLLSQGGLQQLAAARRASEDDDISTGNLRKRKHDSATSSDDPLSSALNLTKRSPSVSPKSGDVNQVRPTVESPLDLSGSKRLGDLGLQLSGIGSGGKLPKLDANSIAGLPWAAAAAGTMPFLHPLLAGSNVSPDALSRFGLAGLAGLSSSASESLLSTAYTSSTTAMPSLTGAGGLSGASGLGSVGGLGSMGASKLSGELRNPLDRMSEIAKGGSPSSALPPSSSTSTSTSSSMRPSLGPRHSAWQSQWISRGPESNKDIFKCVWCKDSFSSLQLLTVHMKETKHFGGNIPPSPQMPVRSPLVSPSTATTSSRSGPVVTPPSVTPPSQNLSSAPPNHSSATKPERDILKEQLPMPRKLVRGQDVWLGRGEQQTKDILKCMWCGQSFRTLEIMTKHMQETKHYTKVISQEQLVSWKSPDSQVTSQNHVNAVLTCKVCEQAFSSLKELSDHMMKNNHYKDAGRGGVPQGPVLGPDTPGHGTPGSLGRNSGVTTPTGLRGAPSPASVAAAAASLNNQSKEKRKKSLPVRKLLELERAQQELTGQVKSDEATGRISCEKCGEKIPMHVFVDHIRQCVGPLLPLQAAALAAARSGVPPTTSAADFLNVAGSGRLLPTSTMSMTPTRRTPSVSPPRKSPVTPSSSLFSASLSGGNMPKKLSAPQNLGNSSAETDADEPKSILGSLEQMVQKNFGAKKRQPGPDSNMSILQRLGIDEGVDYSKPLVDPMAAMSAMFRPPPGSSMASLAGFLPPFSHSTSTRSNSSECSSPDRFKNDRPPSIKSDSSIKSPPLEENPLPASSTLSALQRSAGLSALLNSHTKFQNSFPNKDGKDNKKDDTLEENDNEKDTDDMDERDQTTNDEQDKEDINEKSAKLKKSSKTVTDDKDTEYSDKYLNPDADIKDNGTTLSPKIQSRNHSPSPARSDCASPPHSAHPVATILGDITTSPSRLSSNNNKSRASSPSNSNDEMPNSNHYSDINEEDECKKLEKCDSASDISNDDKESSSKTPAKNNDEDDDDKEKSSSKSKKKPKSHPLAALQMLCDKTEKPISTSKNGSTNSTNSSSGNYGGPGTDPGAILAFSWACNQAVVNDSLLKCPFCDTPFISKGAYRHHLSKMHFVKDGSTPDPKMFMKAAQQAASSGHPDDKSAAVVMAAAAVSAAQQAAAASAAVAAAADTKEENTQSKFQKYSQLAKQLSCSSQP